MTPRERVLAALRHEPTDRIPFAWGFGMNRPVREAFRRYMGFSDEAAYDEYVRTRSDIRSVAARYAGPAGRETKLPDGGRIDVWGVTRRPVSYGADVYYEISEHPLARASRGSDLDAYRFPSADWYDYSNIRADIERLTRGGEYAILTGNCNLFESAWYLRGFERIFVDLMDRPEFVEDLMTRVTDFFVERARRVFEAADGGIDIAFTADDIGQQGGLLVSKRMWEERIKPHHARLNRALHAMGAKVLYHSDGSVVEALDGLIEIGVDALEAVQPEARGMDPVDLKRIGAGRLAYHGGIGVQGLLPFAKPDEVEAEVARVAAILGEGGGYVAAPSHAIQAGTPPENVAAMLRALGRL